LPIGWLRICQAQRRLALFWLAFLLEIGDDSGSSPGNRTSQEQAQLDKV